MVKHLVNSTAIYQIAYEEPKQTLFIYFKNSPIYSFENVPQECFQNFLSAKSKGSFYHLKIKGKFKENRLDN